MPTYLYVLLWIALDGDTRKVCGQHAVFNAYHYIIYNIIAKETDITQLQQAVKDVLNEYYATLGDLLIGSDLQQFARELCAKSIITPHGISNPSFDDIMRAFCAGIKLKRTRSKLENYCSTFVDILVNIGGPLKEAAEIINDEWRECLSQ